MALHPLALQIIAPQATPRPGLPSPFGTSALTGFSGALAVFDMLSEGDLTGNGYRLLGDYELTSTGLLLPGGVSGLSIGLVPPSGSYTMCIAAKAAADAAADGFFVSCLDTDGNVGAGIRYVISTTNVQGQVLQASGTALTTTTAVTRALDTWFAVCFRTNSALAPPSNIGFMLSNTSGISATATVGALNTPTKNFRIGDGWTATKGVKGTLGMLAIYDGLKSQGDMAAIIAAMRSEMATKHGVTIP